MHRTSLAIAAIAMAGCLDTTLELKVVLPESGPSGIESYSLEVFGVDASNPDSFTCAEIRYRDVPEDRLAGSLLMKRPLDASGEIPRVGDKLLVVRGFIGSVEALAGCVEVENSTGEIELQLSPTVLLSSDDAASSGVLPEEVKVSTVDVNGSPLVGQLLRWRLLEPGPDPAGDAFTDPSGLATIGVATTDVVGVHELVVDAPWFTGNRLRLTGVAFPDLAGAWTRTIALEDSVEPTHADAVGIGANGLGFLVRTGARDGSSTTLHVHRYQHGTGFVSAGPAIVAPSVVNLTTIRRSSGDAIIALTSSTLVVIDESGPSTPVTLSPPLTDFRSAAFGPCGDDDSVVVRAASGLVVVDLDGNQTPLELPGTESLDDLIVQRAGCVATGDGELERLLSLFNPETQMVSIARPQPFQVLEQGALRAAFAPTRSAFREEVYVLKSNPTGFSLQQLQLTQPSETSEASLVLVDQTSVFSSLTSLVVGDFEGTAQSSLVAVVPIVVEESQRTASIIYGSDRIDGERVFGTLSNSSLRRVRHQVFDFDGDGFDDILLSEPGSSQVIRMGAPP